MGQHYSQRNMARAEKPLKTPKLVVTALVGLQMLRREFSLLLAEWQEFLIT